MPIPSPIPNPNLWGRPISELTPALSEKVSVMFSEFVANANSMFVQLTKTT